MAAGARIRAVVCPVLVAGAATAVFAPALRAFLHADDFCHCFDAMNRSLPGFAVQPWGGHVYLFRNALLWCLVHAFGMETRGYFTAILFAHALNVVLLHRVLRRYGAAPALACLAAAAWGTSPLLAGTLGWIAALGQVVLATVFLGLLLAVAGARERGVVRPRDVVLWVLLAFLASTSFGMGLAVAGLLPLLAWWCGPPAPPRVATALWLTPVALLALYFVVRDTVPSPVGSLVDDTVSIGSALGAWRYVVVMAVDLVVYGASSLCLGFYGTAVDRAATVRAVLATGSGVVLVAGLARMDSLARRRTIVAVAVGLGAYALVAAGRSPFLEIVKFTPLKAATVARYHYFPTLGLAIGLGLALAALARGAGRVADAAVVTWMAIAGVGFARHPPAIDTFEVERRATLAAFAPIRAQLDAAPPGAAVVVANVDFAPAKAVPCEVAGLAGAWLCAYGADGTFDGRSVRFAVPRAELEAARGRGDRIARLMVPKD